MLSLDRSGEMRSPMTETRDESGRTRPTTEQVRKFGPPGVLAVIALLFVFQNTEDANFTFLWFNFTAPLWLMLLLSMVVGAVIFWGAAQRRRRRKAAEA
jgi:hypothetical protein